MNAHHAGAQPKQETQMIQDPVTTETDLAPAEAEAGNEEQAPARRVPVSESIRYRRRAQAAEQQLEDLQAKFAEAQSSLRETQRQLEHVERRQRIDELLMESDAVDLEAARLLTEIAVESAGGGAKADLGAAVAQLKERKPYLFRRGAGAPGGAMSPRQRRSEGGRDLNEAASSAITSGNRRDLLRYLRLRRGAK